MVELIHYVLLKFPGGLDEGLRALLGKTYAGIGEALDSVTGVEVRFNCVERDQNMDAMVRLDLKSEVALKEYLTHPLHTELVERLKGTGHKVVSFDYLP